VRIGDRSAGHELHEAVNGCALAAETDSNPFFVAEIVRNLLESEPIAQRSDGRWELRRD
jgi:hypothetical protein